MRKLLAWDAKKGKKVLVGEYEKGVLYKTVSVQHFMRVVGGYGIQVSAFPDIKEKGIVKIEIKEAETHTVWHSDLMDWEIHSRIADYGHGKQCFLSTKYMKKQEPLIGLEEEADGTYK